MSEEEKDKLKNETEEFQDNFVDEIEEAQLQADFLELDEIFVSEDDEIIVLSDPESPSNPDDRRRIEDLVSTTDVSDSEDEVKKIDDSETAENTVTSTSEGKKTRTPFRGENFDTPFRGENFDTSFRGSTSSTTRSGDMVSSSTARRLSFTSLSTTSDRQVSNEGESSVLMSNNCPVVTLEEEEQSVGDELEDLTTLVKNIKEDLDGVTLPVIKDLSMRLNRLEAKNGGRDDDNNHMIEDLHENLQQMVDEICSFSVSYVALGDGLSKQEEVSDSSEDELEQEHGDVLEEENEDEDAVKAHKLEKKKASGRNL